MATAANCTFWLNNRIYTCRKRLRCWGAFILLRRWRHSTLFDKQHIFKNIFYGCKNWKKNFKAVQDYPLFNRKKIPILYFREFQFVPEILFRGIRLSYAIVKMMYLATWLRCTGFNNLMMMCLIFFTNIHLYNTIFILETSTPTNYSRLKLMWSDLQNGRSVLKMGQKPYLLW